MGQVRQAVISIEFDYEEGANGPFTPILRNLAVEDVTSGRCERPLVVKSFPKAEIRSISIRRCDFRGVQLPSQIAYVNDLRVSDVTVNGAPSELV
jgi:hypothetical protein